MSDELYFDVELKKCLDTAGFSDCGENDQWDWWYQRIHRAHDASVDRVTESQRAEIAKLRDENRLLRLMRDVWQENDASLREQNSELLELVRTLIEFCANRGVEVPS